MTLEQFHQACLDLAVYGTAVVVENEDGTVSVVPPEKYYVEHPDPS